MNFRKGNITLIVLPILLIIGVAVGGYLYLQNQNKVKNQPLTWEECIKVPGAMIMEMYPAKCSTPDGRSAIQLLSDEEKKNLNQLPVDLVCKQDSECALIIDQSWTNCKLQDTCEPADYSQEKWIAVNQQSYSQVTWKNCPDRVAAMCNPKPINDRFMGKCLNNMCQKVAY